MYLQIFEWHSISTLLSWQKSKTDREIYEDNRTDFKNFKLSYHNTEKRIQKMYKCILPLYTLVFLAAIVGTLVIDRAEWFLLIVLLKLGQIFALTVVFVRFIRISKKQNHKMHRIHRNFAIAYFIALILYTTGHLVVNFTIWFETV